ncbi:LysR family transcriptional regulator [Pseudonocardia endophytica]|uniref:DNA-binding transcriptional LysR family regulator n=1 Tax=Pseudonocardia endophytica TaxID=401976 RepID=A0A4R1HP36_PSEEN|nr:LysR family transcriptional regulator [Pseudonocardia endophytica]TCK22150.1 DNA-binding transcriptional LysR family regulator [Pseudonocardia endophytica]
MEIRQLRYAVAVAEHGHFGRAAAALGIAQPPLSRQIAALESELDVRLFERGARGAVPTAAGAVFVDHARQMIERLGAGVEDTRRAARGESGRLRIGFIGAALVALLPSLLARHRRVHPAVELEMTELSSARATAALHAGELDVAVVRGAPRGRGADHLVSVPVATDRLVVACRPGHPLDGQTRITVDRLRGYPLIAASSSEEPATTDRLHELLDAPDRVTPVTRARDVHTILGLAACGVGVGLLPSCVRVLRRPDVRILDVDPPLELPDLCFVFRRDDRSPVLRAFLDVTAEHCPGTGAQLAALGVVDPSVAAPVRA